MLCPACWIILPYPWGKLVKTQLFGEHHFKGFCENVVFLVLPMGPVIPKFSTHIPKLNPIGRAVPEIQKRSVHVQRYPTRDYCISCNQWVPKCRTKFQCNRPNHYRVTASGTFIEKGCARAHVQMHSTHDLWKALSQLMTPNPHTKFEHIGQAVLEIQKRGVGGISARAHVQRYPTRDYCISCNLWAPKCIPNFNTIDLAVTELQKDMFL